MNKAAAIEQPPSETALVPLAEFQDRIAGWHDRKFGPAPDPDYKMRTLFEKLVQEAAEFLEVIDDPEKRREEWADMQICILGLAAYAGIDGAFETDRKLRIIEYRPVVIHPDGHRTLAKGPYG